MQSTIITVGDEILIGQVIDTNSAWLGQKLSEIGIQVKKIISVSDQHTEIIGSLSQALNESDIVFMTGGLGPTKDDITKKAIADFLGVDLFFHQDTYDRIKGIFERMGRPMSPSHDDQCLMPRGVQILKNDMGTAPGMLFQHMGKRIVSMPGVPYEMKSIMENEVIPLLKAETTNVILHKTILTSGAGETTIENKISDIVSAFPEHISIAYLPALAKVRLRISASGQNEEVLRQEVSHFTGLISARIDDLVYGYDDTSLEKEIHRLAIEKGLKIATAESCTGGLIASKLVSVPGSSAYFVGGIVAYSNDLKINILKVNKDTLAGHGAVSEATVLEMVDGAIDVLGVDMAVAVSGIAGPDGGSPEKPVGTIWICAGSRQHKVTYLLKAGKDREKNMEIASVYALNMLRKCLIEE
jgi:nicotinamide-nucleotide amidase